MKKRSLKTRLSAVMLAAAMVVSVAAVNPAGSKMSTVDAANKKVYYITQAKNSSGDTIKYTYNKNGTLKKSVATSTSKNKSKDIKTTTTTTFSYNKNNNISSKTVKYVESTTYYNTDKTTSLTRKEKLGTVNDIYTTVTKYTYNKKKLATQTVSTTTHTMTGSEKSTSKSSIYNRATELSNGKLLAGYNYKNPDGTNIDEVTSKDAYYYEMAGGKSFADTSSDTTYTTTYTDKGGGKYSVKTVSETSNANYSTENNYRYFRYIYDDNDNESVVELTKLENDPDGYNYKDAKGNKYSSYSFTTTTSVTVTINNKSSEKKNVSTDTEEEIISDKVVTTRKYTYDNKKRIKKETVTSVSSQSSEKTEKNSSSNLGEGSEWISSYYDDKDEYVPGKYVDYTYTSSSEVNSLYKSSEENTDTYTITYTYDKKGRVKKAVTSNPGKSNYKSSSASYNKSYKVNTDRTYEDGKKGSYVESYTISGYPSEHSEVVANGKRTYITTYNSYTKNYSENSVGYDESSSKSGTETHSYYSNGGSKVEDKYTYKETGKEYYGGKEYTNSGDRTVTRYTFDKDGKANGRITTDSNNSSGSAYYTDGKDDFYDVAATQKIEAEKAKLTGTVFVDSVDDKDKVYDKPSQSTNTYTYDKKGNVSSVKTTGYRTDYVQKRNETYGNTIYEFNTEGIAKPIVNAVKHSFTNKKTNENTVKSGSKSLSKVLTMATYSSDGSSSSGYSLEGRVVYTVKSKKLSKANATITQKQQWILQNGHLSGTVGL